MFRRESELPNKKTNLAGWKFAFFFIGDTSTQMVGFSIVMLILYTSAMDPIRMTQTLRLDLYDLNA